jgi:hypothetical protein
LSVDFGPLSAFLKDKSHRVDAPALVGGHVIALSGEDVTQVRIAVCAADFGTDTWSQGAVFD